MHYKNFRKPIILGVACPEEARGFTVPLIAVIAKTILSLLVFPIMFFIFGLMTTAIVGNSLGMVIILGGIGLTLYNVVTLITGYMNASGSVRRCGPPNRSLTRKEKLT